MSQTNGPTSSDSAEPAEQRFYLDLDGADIQFNEVKCPGEKKVTPHQWLAVKVGDNYGQTDALHLLELSKRLILCQSCGTVRLIK